jgi:hypothetical protein
MDVTRILAFLLRASFVPRLSYSAAAVPILMVMEKSDWMVETTLAAAS